MNRKEIRKFAFELLFQKCFREVDDIDFFEENSIYEKDKILEIVNGVQNKLIEIDKIITDYSPLREFSRIARVNLTILRIAIYEILYDDLTPTSAAIQEAVSLCENYSYDDEDRKFINGLLGKFSAECSV